MEEGINFNLVLSGATLVGIISIVVRLWISERSQKIEQPLNVQTTLCERQIKSNYNDHSNIFCRLSATEQRISAVESSVSQIDKRLISMDTKLDKLLTKEHNNEG